MTIKLEGYKPFDHQKAVHRILDNAKGSGIICAVKAKRQVGKTTMSENIALKVSAEWGVVCSCIVEPTLNQSRRVYKEIVKAITGTPFLKRKNDSLLEIEFGNGSTLLFKSAEQRDSLRGFVISGILIIDEASFVLDEIYDILQPTCDVHKAPILMVSTPKLKQGFFYRYYTAGMEGSNPSIVAVNFNDFDLSFFLSKDKLEQYRQMMPKSQFQTEYLGEFLDTDSVLFTGIGDCLGEATDLTNLYVGIDWGSGTGGDYTSMATFNGLGQMVDCIYFNDKGTLEQAVFIADYLCKYARAIRRIQAESNSIGTPMIALLKDTLQQRGYLDLVRVISPFVTTNQEKVRLVNQLQVGLEQHQITLLNDRGLISQLASYEATYNPKTGVVSYNAPQGLHDDNCISTMLGYDAFKNSQRVGNYNISVR